MCLMYPERLRTNVVNMTTNWMLAQSLIAERDRELQRAESRRWPDLDRARRMRSAREIGRTVDAGQRRARQSFAAPTTSSPARRLGRLFRGVVLGYPTAQR